jgi:hypothetical protein
MSDAELPAGGFSAWFHRLRVALDGSAGSAVPCDGCTACCCSSQFVAIAPDETESLAHIPPDLLFPAPRRPPGHVLLGYDEHGRCPMLGDAGCSIYAFRPRTCRTYDCRVFPATGLSADDDGKPLIARRARRWRFDFPAPGDSAESGAVHAAAALLGARPDLFPSGAPPPTATARAVLAVAIADAFVGADPSSGNPTVIVPDDDLVRGRLARAAARSS